MQNAIKLCKVSQRRLNDDIIKTQIDYAIKRALGGNRSSVWQAKPYRINHREVEGDHLYCVAVPMARIGRSAPDNVLAKQLARMQDLAAAAVRSKGWRSEASATAKTAPAVEAEEKPQEMKMQTRSYADVRINIDPHGHFAHLFDLDAQIELVLSAVEEYTRSSFENRFHCVLYGAPACGKTEILRSLTRMLGTEAVMHFDATSTTSAGAKKLLTETAQIPPVLCVEEIEKADEQSLRWLLGVLDQRAEVRSLKFREGLVSRQVNLLCLATVNDFGLFKNMMDGALASRFSHKIHCPRPSREVLKKILQREIVKHEGNPEWIEPALDWCIGEEKTNDPRRIVTVCLCGRDKLLTGAYQERLRATMGPKEN